MASPPHALVIPYPAQGHVIPLMELAHALVDRGFLVTFINSEFNHDRIFASMSSAKNGAARGGLDRIRLVAVPDGMAPDEDRNNLANLSMHMVEFMAPRVEELIRRSGEAADGGGKITCMVTDYNVAAWTLDIARRTGLRSGVIWPASAAVLATVLSIPKLIQDNIIHAELGCAIGQVTFQLSPDMPPMDSAQLAWNCIGDHDLQETLFRHIVGGVRAVDECDFILCNSFRSAEPATFARFPRLVPAGPFLTGERSGKAVGHFWRPEDDECMSWLDAQPARSVVYVAFGSFTMFDRRQFQELALGLELSGRPFLWVVRPDIVHGDEHDYPEGFLHRVAGRAKLVAWSPQQKVLVHPAVACFVSHCGWNSTMEGVRNGVPFLAWPYFADQFMDQVYISDIWKVGLKAVADESGVISKEHIAGRVEELMGDAGMRERVEAMKKAAHESIQVGGTSYENFTTFVEAMKA